MPSLSPLVARIAFSRAKYIGPHNAKLLLEEIPDVEQLMAEPELLRKHFPRTKQRIIAELARPTLLDEAKRIADWCEREQIRPLFITDEDYPSRLSHCSDAPTLLYTKGCFQDWNTSLAVSVVGTRNITSYGQMMTESLLQDLVGISRQMLIVSGLAYGVDILAHRRALALGMPTVAVLAHGFDRIYPAVHRQVAMEILNAGAWVSEYPLGTQPERYNFVGRNRIIAGLTDATIVIEAGAKSGSLTTAELAAGYNREVLAVPGRTTDRYSEGCNKLLAELKAVMITRGEDLSRALGLDLQTSAIQPTLDFGEALPLDNPILSLIAQYQPVQINELIQRSGLSMSELSTQLFELELDGHISTMPGGLYKLGY